MTEDEFEDELRGLTPEQAVEARAVLDELADARRAAAMIEGHVVDLLARLGRLSDAQAAASNSGSRAREDARRSFAAQAGIALRTGPAEARARLAMAEQIHDDCPVTLAALREGRLSLRHAEQVVKAGLPLDAGGRASLDHGAVALGEQRTARQLGKVLDKQAADVDSRSFRERHADARAHRHVTIRDVGAGMSELLVCGPTVEVRSVFDRVDQMAREIKKDRARARRAYERAHGELPEEGWMAPVSGGLDGTDPEVVAASDQRTLPQVRTDLLLDVLLTSEPGGHELFASGTGAGLGQIRAGVQVTIPVTHLIDPETDPEGGIGAAWLDDGTLIDADTARILAGNTAGWDRIFIRPESGTIEAVDHYRPTTPQRRAVMARDMTCRIPGCEVPGRSCDIDHGHDYARGGPTRLDNLEALCPAHHQMKHQAGWTVTQTADGVVVFTTPAGHVVTDEPISRVFFHETPRAAHAERQQIARDHAVKDQRVYARDRKEIHDAGLWGPVSRSLTHVCGRRCREQDAGVDPDEFLAMLTDGRITDPQADTWMLY